MTTRYEDMKTDEVMQWVRQHIRGLEATQYHQIFLLVQQYERAVVEARAENEDRIKELEEEVDIKNRTIERLDKEWDRIYDKFLEANAELHIERKRQLDNRL